VSDKPPISIALIGFDGQEELEMRALFSRSEHWQQPWRVVSQGEAAQIVLLPADSPEELARWHHWSRELPCARLIAYAQHPPENALWHLVRKHDGNRPSLLEFAGVLKQIAALLETNQINLEGRRNFEESPPLAEGSDELITGIENPSSHREEKKHRNLLSFFKSLFKGER
jgi:hypothetical protein